MIKYVLFKNGRYVCNDRVMRTPSAIEKAARGSPEDVRTWRLASSASSWARGNRRGCGLIVVAVGFR